MRLIDADALIEDIREHSASYFADDFAHEWVDQQPTIEPERKKGKWIRITQGSIPEIYICPFCKRTIKDAGIDSLVQIRYPFCHCGADMREEN